MLIIYANVYFMKLIASQALITATFSLLQQIINSKAFPPLRMQHTSETIQGQVYIPAANWGLMILTVIVVGAFKSTRNLTNAYGFAVATVMFSTSCLLAVHMRYVKGWPVLVGIGYFLIFGFFDGVVVLSIFTFGAQLCSFSALFWGAALKKVPLGAWVPLMIGVILLLVMWLWVWAKVDIHLKLNLLCDADE
jgi:KUP system potassium uptake protein